MKKTLSLLVVLSILILGIICAKAKGTGISAGNASCKAGETALIPISISESSGFTNLGIAVEYDSSVLTLVKASGQNTGALFTPAKTTAINPYNMSWDAVSDVKFNGVLANLEFEVSPEAKSGVYPIKVSYYKGRDGDYIDGVDVNYDENFNPLNLSYTDGYVTVTGGTTVVYDDDPTDAPEASPTITPAADSMKINNLELGDNIKFEVILSDKSNISGNVIAAAYADDGVLQSVKIYTAEKKINVLLSNAQNAKKAKVMWWNGASAADPISEPEEISIR